MDEHTKEPWSFYDDRSSTGRIEIVGLGKTVARIYLSVPSEDFDNARRIVACVNACAGIPTDMLEAMPSGPASLLPMYAALEKQRDRLLAALEMVSDGPHDAEAIADMLPTIRAAIASVKGGAA